MAARALCQWHGLKAVHRRFQLCTAVTRCVRRKNGSGSRVRPRAAAKTLWRKKSALQGTLECTAGLIHEMYSGIAQAPWDLPLGLVVPSLDAVSMLQAVRGTQGVVACDSLLLRHASAALVAAPQDGRAQAMAYRSGWVCCSAAQSAYNCNSIPSLDAQALARLEGSRYCDSKSHQERVPR